MNLETMCRRDPGIAGALGLAHEHDPDPQHALQVCTNALALFDCTAELHGLGEPERRLLTAAALLHDVGWSTRPQQHHKGSRDLILESEPGGFSGQELMVVGCVARYHRKAHPKPTHKVYQHLDAESQGVVERLAAILRLADGLDRSHGANTLWIRTERLRRTFRIRVGQRLPNDTDIDGAMGKRHLFEQVFGLAVNVVPEPQDSAGC